MTVNGLAELGMEALVGMSDVDQDIAIAVLKASRDPANREESRIMCDFYLALADVMLSRPRPAAGELVRAYWAME